MGQPLAVICHTCKTEFYLGYGSGEFRKHIRNRFPDAEHEGHDVEEHCSDYTTVINGDLYDENPLLTAEEMVLNPEQCLICRDWKNYKRVDLSKEHRE